MVWRFELGQLNYSIRHRPGKDNVAPDAMLRICSSMSSVSQLWLLHDQLGHPGFARMYHFIRSRNLPYTSEETKDIIDKCGTCLRLKPRFFNPAPQCLVKATRPWERLSVDFKGPVRGSKPYLLIIVDEYSRYPFVFPCSSTSSATVMDSLNKLFCLFGFPSYLHSDRGAAFMSRDFKAFLAERGIASSRSSPYHPTRNSQCERVDQIVWKTIKLLLHSRAWPEERWGDVLNVALHSVRTLLCTATNETPHERMFRFQRKATFGHAMPTWLLREGSVLLCRHVRSKSDPLCGEVLLLEANPSYAHVRYSNGREDTVSTLDLAPCPDIGIELSSPPVSTPEGGNAGTSCDVRPPTKPDTATRQLEYPAVPSSVEPLLPLAVPPLRRSSRSRRPPDRYGESAVTLSCGKPFE